MMLYSRALSSEWIFTMRVLHLVDWDFYKPRWCPVARKVYRAASHRGRKGEAKQEADMSLQAMRSKEHGIQGMSCCRSQAYTDLCKPWLAGSQLHHWRVDRLHPLVHSCAAAVRSRWCWALCRSRRRHQQHPLSFALPAAALPPSCTPPVPEPREGLSDWESLSRTMTSFAMDWKTCGQTLLM